MKLIKKAVICLLIGSLVLSLSGCGISKLFKSRNENAVTDGSSGNGSTGDLAPGKYSVYCMDENGDAVEGAVIQFCDDRNCITSKSNKLGMAYLDTDGGTYEVHALKAPEGYEIVTTDTFIMDAAKNAFDFEFRKTGESNSTENTENNNVESGSVTSAFTLDPNMDSLKFNTMDLDGNPIDESIFENADVTLINYFESWCPWCLEEIPDLEEFYEKYADNGKFQIIGVCTLGEIPNCDICESDEDEIRDIISEYNITYPVIQNCEGLSVLAPTGRPTSYFINSKGEILAIKTKEDYKEFLGPNLEYDYELYMEYYEDKESWDSLTQGNKDYLLNFFEMYDNHYEEFLDAEAEEFESSEICSTGILEGYYPPGCYEFLINLFLGKK